MASSNFPDSRLSSFGSSSSSSGGGHTETKAVRTSERESQFDEVNRKLLERIRLVNMLNAVCSGDVKSLKNFIETDPSSGSTTDTGNDYAKQSELRKLHDLIATSTGADKEESRTAVPAH